MKKFLISIIGCLFAVVTYAQSTCETRVDAHQKATTRQRVAYCLTPDTVAADDSYSGLVFSGVSSHQPRETTTKQERPTAKPGRFKPENVTISRSYVATAQFPQATQSNVGQAIEATPVAVSVTTQSGQPIVIGTTNNTGDILVPEEKFMYVSSPAVSSAGQIQTGGLQPVERFMSDEVNLQRNWSAQPVVETKTGLQARQTKPGRTLKQAAMVEEQPKQPEQAEQSVQVVQTVQIDQPVQAGQSVQADTDTNKGAPVGVSEGTTMYVNTNSPASIMTYDEPVENVQAKSN